MEASQFKAFCDQSFIAFPGLKEWIEKLDNPSATVATWSKTLARVEYRDAEAVLDGWIDGSIPDPPVGFRRECFAIDVRACSKRFSDARFKEEAQVQQWKKQNRGRYQSPFTRTLIGPAMVRIWEYVRLYNEGQLSEEERDFKVQQVVQEYTEKIDANQRAVA